MSSSASFPPPAPGHPASGANPFSTRVNTARRLEGAVAWLFRLATYFVLVCGLAIFATIFWKGSATVFRTEFPFINTAFFTQSPETLYV